MGARVESGRAAADAVQVTTLFAPLEATLSPLHEVRGDLVPGRELRLAGAIRIHGDVDRSQVHAGGALTVDGRAGGATLVSGGDMSLVRAHSCAIRAAGALRFTGSGASDCDIDVDGDVIAQGRDSAIRSGFLRVGGRLWARELAGRRGARLRVVMGETRHGDDLVRADIVRGGVDIVVCGELLRFDRFHTEVQIGVVDGRAVISSI